MKKTEHQKIDLNKHDFEKELSKFLSEYNFLYAQRKTSKNGFFIIYRYEDMYVKIYGSIHPYDYPYYINILLGNGCSDYPHYEKNAVSLWKIIRKKNCNDDSSEYDFDILDKENGASIVIDDLKKYAVEFLRDKIPYDPSKY